jgi:predicted enzyme related to lactoylglutathione lyase
MATQASRFVWYELMTNNMGAAAAFYQSVVGWQARPLESAAIPYSIFSMGDTGIAGLMPNEGAGIPKGIPPCWNGYLSVPNVDDYAQRVVDAGGQLKRPAEDIPDVGRFAVVSDPQGAVFMLFSESGGHARPPITLATKGNVGWHELHAVDGPSAFDFYSKVFGWDRGETIDMGENGVYQLFTVDGEANGGIFTKMAQMPMPCWLYYFNVDAINAAVAAVKAGGGKLLMEPMEVPTKQWVVQCTDPQGAMFALVAPKR